MQSTGDPDNPSSSLRPSAFRRIAVYCLEALLVLVILGLLAAYWLPAFIGATPENLPANTNRSR